MDRYAFYIWTSYALAALVLVINVLLPLWQRRGVFQRLREFYRLRQERE